MGLFRQPRRRGLRRTASHLIRDSQLQGMQMERHDAGSAVSRPARMGDSPESSPHHDVTRRAHLGAGIDITKDEYFSEMRKYENDIKSLNVILNQLKIQK